MPSVLSAFVAETGDIIYLTPIIMFKNALARENGVYFPQPTPLSSFQNMYTQRTKWKYSALSGLMRGLVHNQKLLAAQRLLVRIAGVGPLLARERLCTSQTFSGTVF